MRINRIIDTGKSPYRRLLWVCIAMSLAACTKAPSLPLVSSADFPKVVFLRVPPAVGRDGCDLRYARGSSINADVLVRHVVWTCVDELHATRMFVTSTENFLGANSEVGSLPVILDAKQFSAMCGKRRFFLQMGNDPPDNRDHTCEVLIQDGITMSALALDYRPSAMQSVTINDLLAAMQRRLPINK